MIAWIRTIDPEDAEGELKTLYERVRTPHGTVDNVMRAHSLRPHTLEGHLVLYRSVLHFHETCVLVMLVCATAALLQARRLGLPRGPDSPEIEITKLVSGLRWHRVLGRTGVIASLLGFASATVVLWGMFARAG